MFWLASAACNFSFLAGDGRSRLWCKKVIILFCFMLLSVFFFFSDLTRIDTEDEDITDDMKLFTRLLKCAAFSSILGILLYERADVLAIRMPKLKIVQLLAFTEMSASALALFSLPNEDRAGRSTDMDVVVGMYRLFMLTFFDVSMMVLHVQNLHQHANSPNQSTHLLPQQQRSNARLGQQGPQPTLLIRLHL